MTSDRGPTGIPSVAIRRFHQLLRTLPGARLLPWRFRIIGVVEAADELPATLLPRSAILVGNLGQATWVAFACPRHNNEQILLNLSPARTPRWKIADHQLLTATPSIDAFHGGTRCHFWIRQGRLAWVPDRTPRPAEQ